MAVQDSMTRPERERRRRIARQSLIVAALAVAVACAAFFFLLHGQLPPLGGALIAMSFVVLVGALAVFVWALLMGWRLRKEPGSGGASGGK
jgi:protein-S-isoprenylcysteine O-methyltransferase Ste14